MIPIGDIDSPFDLASLHRLALRDLNDHTLPRKIRGNDNTFLTPSVELHEYIRNVLSTFTWFVPHEWEFEVLVSREPVGVHNDRNRTIRDNIEMICSHGMIIPLEWHCAHPYTLTYDACFPEKVIYKKGMLQTLDGQAIETTLDIHTKISHEDRMRYFRDLPHWRAQLKGLTINSIHKWDSGKIIIFESDRLHSSSEFVESTQSYKTSINGLRYADSK